MYKRLLTALAFVAVAIVSAPAAIGTDSAIKSALDLSSSDLTRLKFAVGQHQHLTVQDTLLSTRYDSVTHHTVPDTLVTATLRLATSTEAIAELKSRINEFVRREEGKVGRDTLGQWGGI